MTNESSLQLLSSANYERYRKAIYEQVDRFFGWVMAFQYVLGVVLALVLSPRTWTGNVSSVHPHVWLALLLGGALAALPIVLTTRCPGKESTRFAVAVSQALFSTLLIHLTGGRIETHFHVFGSLAFLAMYRDWRVLTVSTVIIAVDHAVRGLFFPSSVYGIASGAEWRFLEHAAWVLFEDAFLGIGMFHQLREMRGLAERQAELEIANARAEQAAEEIGRKSAILNSVLTGMNDAVVVTDPKGHFIHVNPAAQAIIGNETEISLDRWSERFGLTAGDGVPITVERLPLARALRGESVVGEEIQAIHARSNTFVWLQVSAEPLLGPDNLPMGGVAVFRDVTAQRQMIDEMRMAREQAEKANRAKSEFLSRMSHELRTPMNAILGFGQILKMDDLTEDQEESIDQIIKAGGHLLKLINEVLDIAGIEAGKMTISREPVDVTDVAMEAIGMVRPMAAAQNISLNFEDRTDGDNYALADRQRLLQVLLNLLSNATKYNVRDGEVRISAETLGDRMRISVQDTGPGIPEEKRVSLFNPFERLGAEGSSIEGTGLGLALTKRLVEAMNGELELVPSSVGTCFLVSLPRIANPLQVVTTQSEVECSFGPSTSFAAEPIRLLLIEDNPTNIHLLERVFKMRSDIEFRAATSGLLGLEMAREYRPEVVLLDLDLPDMHGTEVLRLMRGDRRIAATRTIVLTADATRAHAERLQELDAIAYLSKPFDVDELMAAIADTEDKKVA